MLKRFFYFLLICLFLSPNVHAKGPYSKVIKKLTRSDKLYRSQDLRALIIWNVSPLTNSLINAQTNRYAKAYEALPTEKETFKQNLLDKRGNEALFFVSFYSGDRKYGDLANAKAKWELRLEEGGRIMNPSRIEKINSPNPVELILYPYLTPWSRGYYVWFPIDSELLKAPFSVSLHGAQGHSTLTWK